MKIRSRVLFIFYILISAPFAALAQSPSEHRSSPANPLAGLPLVFEPNRGQADAGVLFLSRGPSYTVLLTRDQALLRLPGDAAGKSSSAAAQSISLELLQPHPEAKAAGEQLLPGVSNYFLGKQSANWLSGIPQYAKVAYQSVYPGIDLVYYGTGGHLEYDFVLHPGADASLLRFRINGAQKIESAPDGDLRLQVNRGSIELKQPVVYQQDEHGNRLPVAGRYVLRPGDEVGFELAAYDHRTPLIVDPVLSYSSLISGNASVQIKGIAADAAGNAYITGTGFATDYPVVKPYQSKNGGNEDVFITKLAPGGETILYSTYLGSGGFDTGSAIAVDTQGNAYVTGNIGAADFPTTPGAFMQTCPSICNTPFVAKLLPNGTLGYSTFMGGSNVTGASIAVDAAGSAYITGVAASDDLPTTPGALQTTFNGQICTSCSNAYLEKLNPEGSALVYSTYFGGPTEGGTAAGRGVAVGADGSPVIVGQATEIPVKNALQASAIELLPNAFIAKFTPDASSLVFSTYLGGSSPYFFGQAGDFATGVAVDGFGNVHVTGTSSSCEFPLSLNALSTDCVDTQYDQKQFAVTLNSTGSQVLFSTFLRSGFSGGIAVDKNGNSYVTGTTTATDLPLYHAIESTSQRAASIGFVTELDLTGKVLFSTYLGATTGGSQPAGIALDSKGDIYVAGAGQGDFPLLNAIPSQVKKGANYQAFIAKISPANAQQFTLSPLISGLNTLRNVSSSNPLVIDAIKPSATVTEIGTDCPATLTPGAGCNLVLENIDPQSKPGNIVITTGPANTPRTFSVAAGLGATPGITTFPTILQFPPQLIGTASPARQVVIKNFGAQPAAIASITLYQPGVFTESDNCPAMLAAFASCTASVTYTPQGTQGDDAQLGIVHDPGQTTDTVYLNGTGTSSAILASATRVPFGTQVVAAPPLTRIVNLTNTTPNLASVGTISASTGFAQTNTCSAPLAPQASCRVAVTFLPTTTASTTGTLRIASLGPGGTQTLQLSGNGLIASSLTVSPTALTLYSTIGGLAGSDTVTLTNAGVSAVTLQKIGIASPFTQTSTCAKTLASGGACMVTVVFTPSKAGTVNGKLTVQYSGTSAPLSVPVAGVAQTALSISPSPLDFGQQTVNTSATTSLGIGVGVSHSAVTVSTITVQGHDFALAGNGCPSTFQPFVGCGALDVSFKPSAIGLRTGTLTVVADDSPSPHVVQLRGTGVVLGRGSLSTTNVDFGLQTLGTQSTPVAVQFTNVGTAALQHLVITASPSFFGDTTTCGANLAKGATCTISVFFNPTQPGMVVGALTVQDDGPGSPHVVQLAGTGQ